MKTASDQNLFDLGDQTALVCIDHPQYQKMVVAQLTDLAYKVHLGLFEEDVLLKLATYSYNVVVVYENFKGARADENPILRELMKRSGSLRREHFVILLSHRCATNDPLTAFAQSVDQIINISDLSNFTPVLRRGLAQYGDLYAPFRQTLEAARAR
ncbi:MAG TPA: hypothetical protein VH207_06335 [Chthoniobacterales bacterium]|jgi:hypothetical protein|nr:hypothetical protein [Chthoniobacterales bacterium]